MILILGLSVYLVYDKLLVSTDKELNVNEKTKESNYDIALL